MYLRTIITIFGLSLAVPAVAYEPEAASCDGVLLLRNGGVLHGRITPAGDRYVVSHGDRGELRIPVQDVEMHCRSIHEVYMRKRSLLSTNTAAGRLRLVDWCLRENLLSQAADELLAAIAIDPQNPQIRGLERRLQMAAEEPEQTHATTSAKATLVGLDELEQTTRSLPEGALETFTSQVQPLLLNRCGATSCHGTGGESELHIIRPSWSRTISRRFTQRNLHAVMGQVDFQNPDESPLLSIPNGPHGGIETGLFGARDEEQYKLLAAWVRKVAVRPEPPQPQTIAPHASGLLQASYTQPIQLPATTIDEPGNQGSNPPIPSQPTSSPRVSAGYAPRDPFDAEIFNRRPALR